MPARVYISGGTGYIGVSLISRLVTRGISVTALARPGSEPRIPAGCQVETGNALDASTFAAGVTGSDTYIHLVGTPHPAPWKGGQFRAIDRVSLYESVQAATAAGIQHFIYVSVAHPAPVMQAYIEVRSDCEARIRESGLTATILRPWYVLGPGHRWPVLIQPIYALMEKIPATADSACRLGLVTLEQMVMALVWAVENTPASTRTLDVPAIRSIAADTSECSSQYRSKHAH